MLHTAAFESIIYSDEGTENKVISLLYSFVSSEFIISLVILEMLMNTNMARKLQAECMDVLKAIHLIDTTLKSIQEQRSFPSTKNKVF